MKKLMPLAILTLIGCAANSPTPQPYNIDQDKRYFDTSNMDNQTLCRHLSNESTRITLTREEYQKLGWCYANGIGVAESYKEAGKWYERAGYPQERAGSAENGTAQETPKLGAADSVEFCAALTNDAKEIMANRQLNKPMQDNFSKNDSEMRTQLKIYLAKAAYGVSIYRSKEDKSSAIQEFGNIWFKSCVDKFN